MMKMTATGDSILLQGYPEEGYPGLEEIKAYIAKGEARFGNLETNITDWDDDGTTALVNNGTDVAQRLDPGVALADATVGMVIAANGKAYNTVALANTYSTAVAIIAYKGDGEANSSYNTGLAIALNDANDGNTCQWWTTSGTTCVASNSTLSSIISDLKGIEYTNTLANGTCPTTGHDHAAAKAARDYKYDASVDDPGAHPSNTSQWFLPTIGQWKLMLEAINKSMDESFNKTLSTSEQNVFKYTQFATWFSDRGGTNFKANNYWSSVECSEGFAWTMSFYYGFTNVNYKGSTDDYVRPVLAF